TPPKYPKNVLERGLIDVIWYSNHHLGRKKLSVNHSLRKHTAQKLNDAGVDIQAAMNITKHCTNNDNNAGDKVNYENIEAADNCDNENIDKNYADNDKNEETTQEDTAQGFRSN
ncbi:307_t:CDS:2, partial [Ambispora leptoticha]